MNTRHKMMVTKKPQGVMSTDTREVMLSKFKVKSVGGGSFLHFKTIPGQSFEIFKAPYKRI